MRSNFSRRWSTPHAERALVRKRQTTLEIHPTPSGGFTLTAPTTLTVVETVTESASSSHATSSSSLSSSSRHSESVTITSSSTGQSTSTTSTSTTPLQTPSETASSTTSAPTISPTDGNGNSTIPLDTGALSATQVPGGAIAAIVIACLVVVAVGLFYLFRQKSRRDRTKRRPKWSSGMNYGSGSLGASANSYRSRPSQPRMQFTTPSPPPPMPPVPRSRDSTSSPIVQIPAPPVTVPPRSYNTSTQNNNSNDTIDPALSSSSNIDLISTPKAVYTLGTNGKRSAFSATVISTFITTLPDELSIEFGERLRVVAEYDDGWSLCMNVRGEQGMVPVECLDRSGSQTELKGAKSMSSLASTAASSSSRSWRASRRVSSLRP